MPSTTKDEFKMFTYLGQKIRNLDLKQSACIEDGTREIIGYIKAYALFCNDGSLNDFIPVLETIGRYNWPRMEVTDLSLMLGENIRNVSFKGKDSKQADAGSSDPDLEEDL